MDKEYTKLMNAVESVHEHFCGSRDLQDHDLMKTMYFLRNEAERLSIDNLRTFTEYAEELRRQDDKLEELVEGIDKEYNELLANPADEEFIADIQALLDALLYAVDQRIKNIQRRRVAATAYRKFNEIMDERRALNSVRALNASCAEFFLARQLLREGIPLESCVVAVSHDPCYNSEVNVVRTDNNTYVKANGDLFTRFSEDPFEKNGWVKRMRPHIKDWRDKAYFRLEQDSTEKNRYIGYYASSEKEPSEYPWIPRDTWIRTSQGFNVEWGCAVTFKYYSPKKVIVPREPEKHVQSEKKMYPVIPIDLKPIMQIWNLLHQADSREELITETNQALAKLSFMLHYRWQRPNYAWL